MQPLLESVEYHPIGTLDLSIGSRMGDNEAFTEVLQQVVTHKVHIS
jgi:hypothetical protein